MFKIGDKVRCIDANHAFGELELYKIYTVKDPRYDTNDILLYGVRSSWLALRFELVEEAPKEPTISDYDRGWNDCVAHFASMFLRAS